MKKLGLLFFVAVLLYACSNETSVEIVEPEVSPLIGKWKLSEYEADLKGTQDADEGEVQVTAHFKMENIEENLFLNIEEDSTFSFTGGTVPLSSDSGEEEEPEDSINLRSFLGTWEHTGDKLTLTFTHADTTAIKTVVVLSVDEEQLQVENEGDTFFSFDEMDFLQLDTLTEGHSTTTFTNETP